MAALGRVPWSSPVPMSKSNASSRPEHTRMAISLFQDNRDVPHGHQIRYGITELDCVSRRVWLQQLVYRALKGSCSDLYTAASLTRWRLCPVRWIGLLTLTRSHKPSCESATLGL
jgi:hypothetical protein